MVVPIIHLLIAKNYFATTLINHIIPSMALALMMLLSHVVARVLFHGELKLEMFFMSHATIASRQQIPLSHLPMLSFLILKYKVHSLSSVTVKLVRAISLFIIILVWVTLFIHYICGMVCGAMIQ
jgi:hypothetical protein